MTDQPLQPGQPVDLPPIDPAYPPQIGLRQFLSVGLADTPNGQMLVLGLRVGNATTVAMLTKDQAIEWARMLQTMAGRMSSLVLPGPAALPLPNLNGHGPRSN